MRIQVDRPSCQGHAMCAANGPRVYPLDELGYTALEDGSTVPESLWSQAERGAEACPERVFTIVED
jgi:ferredoxin